MPHIHLTYSANLDAHVDMAALCEALRATAVQIEIFPLAGVRVRALRAEHYAIADGSPAHGFLDIEIRLREGRSPEEKKDAVARLFATAKAQLAPAFAAHPIALSAEIRDISAAFAPKYGTIRDHL